MTPIQTMIREYSLRLVSLPYIWGGDDPIRGFDCSGLVQEVLACVGLDPEGDQTAHQLYWHFKSRGISGIYGCGALVFYGTKDLIKHVGIMIDGYRMLEAGGGNSSIASVDDAVKQNAYIRVRPVHKRTDLVDVIIPNGIL